MIWFYSTTVSINRKGLLTVLLHVLDVLEAQGRTLGDIIYRQEPYKSAKRSLYVPTMHCRLQRVPQQCGELLISRSYLKRQALGIWMSIYCQPSTKNMPKGWSRLRVSAINLLYGIKITPHGKKKSGAARYTSTNRFSTSYIEKGEGLLKPSWI